MKKVMLFLSLLLCCMQLLAAPIKEIVFFGDSLSDNGNLYHYFSIPKSPPYYQGYFSNGPTWAEQLGKVYQERYNISYQNYAVGGATVILRNPFAGAIPFTMSEEILDYLIRSLFSDKSQTLFVVWIGSNDYLDEVNQEPHSLTTSIVNEITAEITQLIYHGALNIVVLNLPDLSQTPYAREYDVVDRLAEVTQLHNKKLVKALQKLKAQYPNVKFVLQDTVKPFDIIINNPGEYNQKYQLNLKNTYQSCWTGSYTLRNGRITDVNVLNTKWKITNDIVGKAVVNSPSLAQAYTVGKLYESGATPCEHPEEYVFWDKLHPTETIHYILANVVEQTLKDEAILN